MGKKRGGRKIDTKLQAIGDMSGGCVSPAYPPLVDPKRGNKAKGSFNPRLPLPLHPLLSLTEINSRTCSMVRISESSTWLAS
jgi:hypothetical protein